VRSTHPKLWFVAFSLLTTAPSESRGKGGQGKNGIGIRRRAPAPTLSLKSIWRWGFYSVTTGHLVSGLPRSMR